MTRDKCLAVAPTGYANVDQPRTWEDGQRRKLIAKFRDKARVFQETQMDERKQFEVHRDFPDLTKTREENLAALEDGYLTSNGDYWRMTLKREYESLMVKRGLRPPPIQPSIKGYLEERIDWMIRSAEQIKHDKVRDQEMQTYGGEYQKLAFDSTGIRIASGPGM